VFALPLDPTLISQVPEVWGQRLSYEIFKTFAFALSLQGEKELSLAKVRATKLESSLCQAPHSLASAQMLV